MNEAAAMLLIEAAKAGLMYSLQMAQMANLTAEQTDQMFDECMAKFVIRTPDKLNPLPGDEA